MPAFAATAPGKIILLGEHAVVYGRPALAVPVSGVQARVTAQAQPQLPNGQIAIDAADIGLSAKLDELPEEHPLRLAVAGTLAALEIERFPAFSLRIRSTIPVAGGLGSGAAISVAVARAVAAFLGRPLSDEAVNQVAFTVEKVHHGTPSGIDNTVVTYAQPVYYVKGQPIQTFRVPTPFQLVIGDTGIPAPTSQSVGDVRQAWLADPARYEGCFDEIARLVDQARTQILAGEPLVLGPLFDHNHELLQQLGVSSPELDRLVTSARAAGALGAKLSGGGRGGNMIALVTPQTAAAVQGALTSAGAVRTLLTTVGRSAQAGE